MAGTVSEPGTSSISHQLSHVPLLRLFGCYFSL